MFCYTGLSQEQVQKIKEDHAVYMTKDGRLSVVSLTPDNVDYVARAIHLVSKWFISIIHCEVVGEEKKQQQKAKKNKKTSTLKFSQATGAFVSYKLMLFLWYYTDLLL